MVAWNPTRPYPGMPINTDAVNSRIASRISPIEIKYDPDQDRYRTFRFDADRANRPIQFIESFVKHAKGKKAGRKFILEPWQRRVIREVFGWIDVETGKRRYSTLFIFLPRKNGKSLLASAIALYLMCADGEIGAEVYFAACDKDQAKLSFGVATSIVKQSEFLSSNLRPLRTAIMHDSSMSVLRPLSSDVKNKDGMNVHGGVIDELHEHPDRRLHDVIVTGTGAREQPLIVITTTAGVNRNSLCYEQYEHAKRVRDGDSHDLSFYPCLFYADADDDFRDPEVWRKANPNLGVSISEDFLRRECRKAIEQPSFEPSFRRYYLNQWVGAAERWISSVSWDMCQGDIGARIEEYAGKAAYLALDVSSTQDITALVAVIPRDPDPEDETDAQTIARMGEIDEIYEDTELGVDPEYGDIVGDGRIFDIVCQFWLPAERADVRERRDKVPYPKWIKQKHITKTAGAAINPVAIRREIHRWGNIVDVKEIAVDPWNAAEMMMSLEGAGFNVVQMRQGTVSMSGPSKAFMRAILTQQIRHHANPVLTWMSGNTVVTEAEGGLIKPSKEKSPERIDGIVCCIMGLSRAMLLREPAGSVYERRGLLGDDGD